VPCHLDHSKLTGLRFCTACGVSLATGQPPNVPPNPPTPFTPTIPQSQQPPVFSSGSTYVAPELPKNKNALIFSIAGGTLAVVLLAGLFVFTRSPDPVSVDVSLTLIDEECFDISWGYFDIPGGDVELEVDGIALGYASFPSYGDTTFLGCEFNATFYNIPADASIYSYSLGSGRRGVITKTREELEADDWSFRLSIG
jgi:hypothetical protein